MSPMRDRVAWVLAVVSALCGISAMAQVSPDASANAPLILRASLLPDVSYLAALTPGAEDRPPLSDSRAAPSDSPIRVAPHWYDDVGVRTRVFLAASVLGVATYGAVKWWDTGFNGHFRSQSEGWFGAGTRQGGADKLGHAFGAYTGARAGAEALELLGNTRDDAVRLATATSLAVFLGIEVLDGFSKNYKFSAEDAVANVAGAGLAYVLMKHPRLDALMDFRLSYRQSPEGKAEGKWEPFADYNGQRYLLVLKASGVPALDANPVLRYVELDLGYGVRGYDPRGTTRSRHLYAGFSLNVSRVLDDTVYRERRASLARRGTGLFLELFQLPGTAVLANRKL